MAAALRPPGPSWCPVPFLASDGPRFDPLAPILKHAMGHVAPFSPTRIFQIRTPSRVRIQEWLFCSHSALRFRMRGTTPRNSGAIRSKLLKNAPDRRRPPATVADGPTAPNTPPGATPQTRPSAPNSEGKASPYPCDQQSCSLKSESAEVISSIFHRCGFFLSVSLSVCFTQREAAK